tara:strand:+ start:92 stop:379 length:288 start_codon:yes stop_codon:yes gene_type:complete
MSNYPDDIRQYDNDPMSPCYVDTDEFAREERFEAALNGSDDETYNDMFNSMDADRVLTLLREFHSKQSTQTGNALVAQLNDMLERHVLLITKEAA